MRSRALAVAALAGLAVAACGEEAAPRKPASATRSPLERRDAPPAGVAKQISYFALGDGCPSDHPPIDFLGSRRLEIAQTSWMCLNGFAPRRPIDVSIARSDGSVLRRRVTPSPSSGKALVTLLDWGLLAPGIRSGATASRPGRGRRTTRPRSTWQPRLRRVSRWHRQRSRPGPRSESCLPATAPRRPCASTCTPKVRRKAGERRLRIEPRSGCEWTADGQLATALHTPRGRGERRYVLNGPANTRAFLRVAVRPAG